MYTSDITDAVPCLCNIKGISFINIVKPHVVIGIYTEHNAVTLIFHNYFNGLKYMYLWWLVVNMHIPHVHCSHIQISRVLLQSQAVKSYKKQNYACLWIQLLILWSHANFASWSFSHLANWRRDNVLLLSIQPPVQRIMLYLFYWLI